MTYLWVLVLMCGIEGIIANVFACRYDNADHWDSFRNFLVHNK
jgi:hypothetical protein